MTLPESMPACSSNPFVRGSSSECRTVARDDVSTEVAASSQNTLLGSTSCPRISGLLQMLPGRVLRSIAAISGPSSGNCLTLDADQK